MKMQSDKEGENMMDEKGGIIFVYKLFPNSSFISHLEAAYPSHLWWSWWCRTLSCPLPPGELFVFGVLTSPDTHSLDLFLRWLTLRYCQSAKCKKRDGERERKRRRKRWRIGEIVVEVVMLIGWRTKKGNLRITSVLILWLSKVFSPSIFFSSNNPPGWFSCSIFIQPSGQYYNRPDFSSSHRLSLSFSVSLFLSLFSESFVLSV